MTGSQAFVTAYAGAAALLVLTAAVMWRRVQPPTTNAPEGLNEIELAALNGGPQLAVIAAATELRRSHVAATPTNTLVVNGPLADGAGELERELYEALSRTPDGPASAVLGDAAQSATVARIVERLEAAGLLLDDVAERRMIGVWLCGVASAAAGVAGLAFFLSAGAHDWAGIGAIVVLTVATLAVTGWIGRHGWGPSAAGRRLLRSVRADRADELRATGGHLALAVAMFGSLALWQTDPAFAAALGVSAPVLEMSNVAAFRLGWNTGHASGGCGGCGGCGGGCGGG